MAALDRFDILILPGLGNSGPEHWQSRATIVDPSATK